MHKFLKSNRTYPVCDHFDAVGVELGDSFMDKLRLEIHDGAPIAPHLLEDPQGLALDDQNRLDSQRAEALIKRLGEIGNQ